MSKLQRQDLIHPQLSYKIVGCAFDVHNSLGGGHHEKYYERALAISFREAKLKFKEQAYYPLKYEGEIVGKNFLDFLVDDKVIVEIKKGNRYSKKHISQVLDYLQSSGLSLAILINFGLNEVSFRRVVNFNS